jgi:hypothetical protein
MKILNFTSSSDIIGASASAMCFIHCLVTPFLFVAYSNTVIIENTYPWWWGILDIVFLLISLFAVYWSTYNTSKQFVKYTFWTLWILLALIIINEKWEIVHVAEVFIHLTTLGLVFLHFYNRRYCQCENDKCCVDAK